MDNASAHTGLVGAPSRDGRSLRAWVAEAALTARVLAGITEYRWAQSRLSLPALVARFAPRPGAASAAVPSEVLVRAVDRVLARLYGRAYCLPRTLLLYRLLPADRAASVVMGVCHEDDALAGHAWIECRGRALGERADPRRRYTVTYIHPSPSDDAHE